MRKRGGTSAFFPAANLTICGCGLLLALMMAPSDVMGQAPGFRPSEIAAAKGAPVPEKPDAVPDELLVQFKPSRQGAAISRIQAAHGIRVRESKRLGGLDWHRIRVQPGRDLKSVVEAYRRDPDVLYAEPNYRVYAHQRLVPNDPRFKELYGLDNTGQNGGVIDADIDGPEAWSFATNSSVVVAVVDTGVDYNHPDLSGNFWSNADELPGNGIDDDGNGYIDDIRGWDFVNHDNDPMDDHGHGTHCAGTIGAIGNNGVGVAGVCWRVKIMPLKFLSASGSGTTADAIEAVTYAANNGAKILNNSWGGGSYSVALMQAIALCESRGAIFVAAAGNNAANNDLSPHYPSSYPNPNIIAVAATTYADEMASFSCYGATSVDLGAPGSSILSTLPGAAYGFKSGTSMATPHVAGACALIWSLSGGAAAWADIRSAILSSVDPLPNLAGKCASGGRLNLHAALQAVNNGRRLTLASPRGGAFEMGSMIPINWRAEGGGWQTGDEVTVHYSADGGTNWTGVTGAEHLDHAAPAFLWDSSALSVGTNYLVRVVAIAETNVVAVAELPFTITGPFDHFDFTMASPQSPGRPVGGECALAAKDGAGRTITTFSSYGTAGRFPVSITAPGVTLANLGGAGHQLETNHFDSGIADLDRLTMTLTASPLPHVAPLTAISADGKSGVSGPVVIRTTPDYFTEYFEVGSCDITNRTVVFTPDGSADFYSARQYSITQLPTDPAGGTILPMADDAYQFITLSGGATVALYGDTNQSLAVGSNGYITFKYGDTANAGTAATHFNLPRVAAWFDDLFATNGQITWKQLADRMAVTWQDVHEYGTEATCTFQIELFFDGRIALSYVHVGATGGLVGLSRGGGEPSDFRQSDLSAYPGPATRTLRLVAPNGGESIPRDQAVTVRWSAAGTDWSAGDTVSLQYSADGGASWMPIPGAASLSYEQGTFIWPTAGMAACDTCLLRVSFTGDTGIRDDSDQWFALLATDRQINLLTPAAGAFIDVGQTIPITWTTDGGDWQVGDTVRLEYSQDAGATWVVMPGAEALPHDQGTFSWNTTGLPRGTTYRVRAVWTTDPAIRDGMAANLILRKAYYVNDASAINDVWCSVPGNDTYPGTSPAAPKASVQSLLAAQDLEPGDVVRIDTGSYTLTSNISIDDLDGGTEEVPVTFEASPYGVTLARNSTSSGTYAWNITADHVVLTTAASNKYPGVAQKWLTITGGRYGVYLNGAIGFRMERAHVIAAYYSPYYTSYGIYAYQSHGTVIRNVISQRHSSIGIYISSSDGCAIENATVLRNGTYGIYGSNSQLLSLFNNVIWADGSGDYCVYVSGGSLVSDHNGLYAMTGANVGYYGGPQPGLTSWQSATGQDIDSISADPRFADADGADNVAGNADDDFHLQSTAGCYHNGAWTADAADSPLIDMGTGDAGAEPEPNSSSFATETEGRRNLGAYGGTEQASKTPPSRLLAFSGPSGGETFFDQTVPIVVTWRLSGSGWTDGDTVQILYSSDGGLTYQPIVGAEAITASSGTFIWDRSELQGSIGYRLKILSNSDGSTLAETPSNFRIGPGAFFYVNDGSVTNEAWCTAAGNDANSGLSPAAPKASVQSIISTYDLEPGDTVRVDSGGYSSGSEITLGGQDEGSSERPVIFEGSPFGVSFNRPNNPPGSSCWNISADYITFRTANVTAPPGRRRTLMAIGGAARSVQLNSANGFRMQAVHVQNPLGISVYATNSIDGTIVNCVASTLWQAPPRIQLEACDGWTIEQNTLDANGVQLTDCWNTVLRNNIIWARGDGKCAIRQTGGSLISDYNDLFASGGANVAFTDAAFPTLQAWRTAGSNDHHSVSADPLFGDEYHLQSSAGRYYQGVWTNDVVDSPAIDMGIGDAGFEPEPNSSPLGSDNEGRRNLGAYGGTELASKTPSGRVITVISPLGGEKYPDPQGADIRWRFLGQGWQPGDTLQILVSSNGGLGFGPLAGAEALPVESGLFVWSLTNYPPGPGYRLRFVSNAESNTLAETPINIRLGSIPFTFYVNDASTAADAWCSIIGADTNTGTAADSPRASIESILSDYDLDPGDVVRIDTGLYALSNNIVVGVTYGGASNAPVTFVASPYGVTLTRDSTNSGAAAWEIAADYITLTTAPLPPSPITAGSWMRSVGGQYGVLAQNAKGITLERLCISGAREDGIFANNADDGALRNVLLSGNGATGCKVWLSLNWIVENITSASNGRHALAFESCAFAMSNCILAAFGSSNSAAYFPDSLYSGDYNDFHATGGAVTGMAKDQDRVWHAYTNLSSWRLATLQDVHSLAGDPTFVDPDGADNVMGTADDDFHLQSTAGSYHAGAWQADPEDSPGIDTGFGDVGLEPVPNASALAGGGAGTRNLGAYGGSEQASLTPASCHLWADFPLGGDSFLDQTTALSIRWHWSGLDWDEGSTISIFYSLDGGIEFTALPGADAVGITNAVFDWDISSVLPSRACRIKIVDNRDGATLYQMTDNFRIGYFAPLYVNDASLDGDAWCAATGDDSNDGLTPYSPKASVQTVINQFDLEPGDEVRIDTGVYNVTNDIAVGSMDSGSSNAPVRFVASPYGVSINRGNLSSGRGWNITGPHVWLGTTNGTRHPELAERWMRVTGCNRGFSLGGGYCRLDRCDASANQYGVYLDTSAGRSSLHNCLVRNNTEGVYLATSVINISLNNCTVVSNSLYAIHFGYSTGCALSNSIVSADGPGRYALYRDSSSYPIYSDYNLLFVTNGAAVGFFGQARPSLIEWRAATGQDAHSLSEDPAFMDAADGDYHLKSTAGSYHAGTWVFDDIDSPGIDAGFGDAGFEPQPNASSLATDLLGRRNLGAYGGTSQGSKTPLIRVVRLSGPRAGDEFLDDVSAVPLEWQALGRGWAAEDELQLFYSLDGGQTYLSGPGGTNLLASLLNAEWNASGLPASGGYRLKIVSSAEPSVFAETQGYFRLGRGAVFYINDASTNGDYWCAGAGSQQALGVSSNAPQSSMQALLDAHRLHPGDRLKIDTGTYGPTYQISITDRHQGTPEAPLLIETSPNGVVFSNASLMVNADYVHIHTASRTGAVGEAPRWMLFNRGGIAIDNAPGFSVERARILSCPSGNSIDVAYSDRATIRNCLIEKPVVAGIALRGSSECLIENTTVVGSSSYGSYGISMRSQSNTVRNCIIDWGLAGTYAVHCEATPNFFDYNNVFIRDAARFGYWNGIRNTFDEWRAASGQDRNSISADPLFVDPDGPDDSRWNEDDDLHPQSTVGSYHGGAWLADAADSPAIDMGDPALPVGAETAPNGLIRNLGAYGGTEQASRSHDADGDQLSDNFEALRIGTDPARFDTDGDGRGDGAEIIAATNPLDRGSYFGLTSFVIQGGDAIVRFPTAANREYLVEFSTDLRVWTQLPNGLVEGTGGIIEVVDPGASSFPRRFYRAQVLW